MSDLPSTKKDMHAIIPRNTLGATGLNTQHCYFWINDTYCFDIVHPVDTKITPDGCLQFRIFVAFVSRLPWSCSCHRQNWKVKIVPLKLIQ